MNILSQKFLEVLRSVVPTFVLVFLIHFLVIDLPTEALISFSFGTLAVIIGLTIFLTGVDLSLTPIGENIGRAIAKSNRLIIVILVMLVLGFFIPVAEPNLTVLGEQIAAVTGGAVSSMSIVMTVSLGVAVLMTLGVIRILYNWSLIPILTILYGIVLVLALFTSSEFISISFDASGATTGAVTIPFILAIASGVASLKRDRKAAEEDSFGLVAISSIGAILTVMLYSLLVPTEELTGSLDIAISTDAGFLATYLGEFITQLMEVAITISPILIAFIIFQFLVGRLPGKQNRRAWIGFIYIYIGLAFFLTGVNTGFMNIGTIIGYSIATEGMYIVLALVGLILGVVTVLAEPSVAVLTQQVEDKTQGAINRAPILVSLCIGVGAAVFLAIIRMLVPGLELWHILLPGYIISVGLTYVVPKFFVGMAFDAGGVATGPITGTFVLAFIQGAAEGVPQASILTEGFGMIALVALMSILTLQILGFIFEMKTKKDTAQQ